MQRLSTSATGVQWDIHLNEALRRWVFLSARSYNTAVIDSIKHFTVKQGAVLKKTDKQAPVIQIHLQSVPS